MHLIYTIPITYSLMSFEKRKFIQVYKCTIYISTNCKLISRLNAQTNAHITSVGCRSNIIIIFFLFASILCSELKFTQIFYFPMCCECQNNKKKKTEHTQYQAAVLIEF